MTYSAAVPLEKPGAAPARRATAREWYLAINELVVLTLQTLGVPASMVPVGTPSTRHGAANAIDIRACFDDAVPGEIVAGGRKLVGSAQWREGTAILQHGSMLIADDQQLLARVAPSVQPAPVASLRQYLATDPGVADFATALRRALDPVLTSLNAPPTAPLELDQQTAATALSLESHYADPAWTWRR